MEFESTQNRKTLEYVQGIIRRFTISAEEGAGVQPIYIV